MEKGFTKYEGINFLNKFSLVANLVTSKLLQSLAAINGHCLTQIDVTNAFLHDDIHEEVYKSSPPGNFVETSFTNPSKALSKH